MSYDTDYLFKIVVIGDSGVGKSCLISQYVTGTFHSTYISTIGVDFFIKEKMFNDKRIKLQIWDTAGQERFRTITYSYYRNADGIMLVYDVTNAETITNIDYWLGEINKYVSTDTPIILVANKIDLVKNIVTSTIQGQQLATKYNLSFFELSALNSDAIDRAMSSLTTKMINRKVSQVIVVDDKDRVRVSNNTNSFGLLQSKKCCRT